MSRAGPTPTVVMFGNFPPPVHGMSVSFESLAVAFEEHARVVRLTTAPNTLARSMTYHLWRLIRVAHGLLGLVRHRRSSRSLIVCVDNGLGMIYTIAAVLLARVLRYRIYLQHHSHRYVNKTVGLMTILARCGGGATHLCSCDQMCSDLRHRYPQVRRTETVSVAYAIDPSDAIARERSQPTLRLGHFSNLRMSKGLQAAVETAEAALAEGVAVTLVLAGPMIGEAEERFVEAALHRNPELISYAGAVYGDDRDRLLASLDVMLFPSRYSHESFALAAWESLRAGTPVIAYRAGCLTQQAVGPGAVVLDPDEDFVAVAVQSLAAWHADPAVLERMSREASRSAGATIGAGRDAVARLIAEIVSAG